jgi:Lar family restriction alleviation protein
MTLPDWAVAAISRRVRELEAERDRLRDELTEAQLRVNALQDALETEKRKYERDMEFIRGALDRERREGSNEIAKLKADLALANARTEFVEVVRDAVERQEVIDAIRAQPPEVDNPNTSKRRTMARPELKPCPFCGERDLYVTRFPRQVRCVSCGAEGPEAQDDDDATEGWNYRVDNPTPPAA